MSTADTEPQSNTPRTATDLVGHADAEAALLEAWGTKRMHHAWLFTGPRGIGKATLAYRFARFVLAGGGGDALGLFGDAPADLAIDPGSSIFRRVATGGHSDLTVLEKGLINPKTGKIAENDIPVDLARKASEFVRMTPAESEWRVIVVDAVDDMNRNAANALLKVLEEPPERALFLMVSHAPGRLLPTIRSRCRLLPLNPLSNETVERLVARQFPQMDPAELAVLSRLAEGSAGQAIDFAQNGGVDLFRVLMTLLSKPTAMSASQVHGLAEQLSRKDAKTSYRVFRDLTAWWMDRFVRALATGRSPEWIVAEEEAAFNACASAATVNRWMTLQQDLLELLGKTDAPANLDRRHVIVSAFLSLETALQGR